PLPPRVHDAEVKVERSTLRVVSPPDGAVYLIDPTLRSEFQAVPLRAAGASTGAIVWSIDGVRFFRGDTRSAVDWPLVPGRHVIHVHDTGGREAEAVVVVKYLTMQGTLASCRRGT